MNTKIQSPHDSTSFYKSIFDQSTVPGIVFRKDGKVLMANNAMEQLYGTSIAEFISQRSIEDLFHPRQRKRVVDQYSQTCTHDVKLSQFIFRNYIDRELIVELRTRALDDDGLMYATISDITEYKSYERQVQKLVDQISVVNETVAAVNSNLNKDQLIRIFFNQIGKIFGYDQAIFILSDIEGKELEIHVSKEAAEISSRKTTGLFFNSFTKALTTCQKIEQDSQAISLVVDVLGLQVNEGFKSQMLIQLKTDEQLIGAVILFCLKENALTKYHFTIFSEISDQVAIAFMKARLLLRFQQSLTNLSFLSKINESLSSSLDLDSVLKQVVESSQQIMQAKICTIRSLENEVQVFDSLNENCEANFIDKFKPQVQQVILNQKPLIVENIDYNSIQFFKNRTDIQNLGLKSLIILPVIANKKTIALLSVFLDKVHYFNEHEVELLCMLADQAAIAIKNADLYNQVERTKNFLESIIHSSIHIIVATDLEGNTTFFNHSACRLTGYAANEVLNMPFFERFINNGRTIFNGLIQELVSKKNMQSFDCEILDKNQQKIPVSWAFSPLVNQHQEIIGSLGIGRAILRKNRVNKRFSLIDSKKNDDNKIRMESSLATT